MNITFEELNTLQKYFDNRVDYSAFLEAMKTEYDDENYIAPLWQKFTSNPIQFITSRTERKVLDFFLEKIEASGYKG